MKKLLLLTAFFCFSFICFPQEINVMDYFPTEVGTMWGYTNENENIMEIIKIENSTKTSANTYVFLFSDNVRDLGTTFSLYHAQNNKIYLVATKDLFGNYHVIEEPYPVILDIPNEKGKYIDAGGDTCSYEVIKSNCKFDDKNFPDCLVVIEKIIGNDKVLQTKKSYYAKGIGLVYETIIGFSEKETVYRKLVKQW